MSTIEQLALYAQAAQAAYTADLSSNGDNVDNYVDAGMSQSQAEQFDANWDVLSQSAPNVDGFSAVLLQTANPTRRSLQWLALTSDSE